MLPVLAAAGGGLLSGLMDYRGEVRAQRGREQALDYLQQPSYLQLDPKSQTQQDLETASLNQYLKQQQMVDDMLGLDNAELLARQGLATDAQGSIQDFLSGAGFAPTESEQERIEKMRLADIAASQNAVQQLLQQSLGGLNVDMARRGVRGQAASQLQVGEMATAADQLNRATLEANRNAARNYLAIPQQRAAMQGNLAGQFANFGDALQQRAFMNRQMLQSPALMQQLQDERIRTGRQYGPSAAAAQMMVDSASYDPEGAFMGGLLSGAGGGVKTAQGLSSLMGG